MIFAVGSEKEPGIRWERHFREFRDACAHAVAVAASGQEHVVIDVILFSEAEARYWGGEDAVEQYHEDPDASVHQRIRVRAEDLGHVR